MRTIVDLIWRVRFLRSWYVRARVRRFLRSEAAAQKAAYVAGGRPWY